jgi:uncharacterized protein (TIGR02246 family)
MMVELFSGVAMTAETLIARHGIMNALANHSRGVDRADATLLGAAYHAQATVNYGFFAGPAADFALIIGCGQKAAGMTLHRTANCDIRVTGDRAVSESYVLAYVEEPSIQRFVFGRYLDRHACHGGVWKLQHRTYVLDGNTNRPTTVARADPPLSYSYYVPEGAKGAADPGSALLAHHIASSKPLQGVKSMPVDNSMLDAALSRDAIRQLICTYCRAVDRGDAELLASIFWEDSTVISGVVNSSGADFAKGVTDYVIANVDYCFHSTANEWIDVTGDHGVGEHYIIAHMCAGGQDVMTGGRYIDSYERRGGAWRIKSRTFVADWNTSHPKSLALDGMYELLKTRGSFGKGDPIYAHWASL